VLAPRRGINQLCYDPSPLQIWVDMQLSDIPVLGIIVQWPGQSGTDSGPGKSSEEATDIVSGIGAADRAHKGWTCQPLRESETALRHSTTASSQEEGKDLLGDLVGGIRSTCTTLSTTSRRSRLASEARAEHISKMADTDEGIEVGSL